MTPQLFSVLKDTTILTFLDSLSGYRLAVACKYDERYHVEEPQEFEAGGSALERWILQETVVSPLIKKHYDVWPVRIRSIRRSEEAKTGYLRVVAGYIPPSSQPIDQDFIDWAHPMWKNIVPEDVKARIVQQDPACQSKTIKGELAANETIQMLYRFLCAILCKVTELDSAFRDIHSVNEVKQALNSGLLFGCLTLSNHHDTLYDIFSVRDAEYNNWSLVEIFALLRLQQQLDRDDISIMSSQEWEFVRSEFKRIQSEPFSNGNETVEHPVDQESFVSILQKLVCRTLAKERDLASYKYFDDEGLHDYLYEMRGLLDVGNPSNVDDERDAMSIDSMSEQDEDFVLDMIQREIDAENDEIPEHELLALKGRLLEQLSELERVINEADCASSEPFLSNQKLKLKNDGFEGVLMSRNIHEHYGAPRAYSKSAVGFLQLLIEEMICATSFEVLMEDCTEPYYVVLGGMGSVYGHFRSNMLTDLFAGYEDEDEDDDSDYLPPDEDYY